MSTSKAQRVILERLGSGATVLLSIHFALPDLPGWADGRDAHGRAVVLVGRHQFGDSEEAQQAIAMVLAGLEAGEVVEGVHAVAYAPKASEAIAELVAGHSTEVLLDGPRSSGKTQIVPAALAILAELHVRAGYALPLRALWLHDTLKNASLKTGRSVESPMWAGLWSLRDDRQVAALTVAGLEHVVADFVGTRDESSAERLRAECHVLAAEEVVPSLEESGGIEERRYELALTSMRLDTRRRVAMCTTNPGDVDTWPYHRWIEGGGQPGCVRCPVPASDRLTPEEEAQQIERFRDSPDLAARLGRGEWSALWLGEAVAEGYDAAVHVVTERLMPSAAHVLAIGWDGGHSPSAVMGQLLGGQVQVFAALNDIRVGVLELIEQQVICWLIQWAPWARQRRDAALVHIIDPSMATPGQATIRESAERTIRETLGGRVVRGPVLWSPRREAVLRVMAPRHESGQIPLAISGVPETQILRKALAGRWHYRRTPDGRVDRSGARKPNSPYADVGDAFANLCAWLVPGTTQELEKPKPRPPLAYRRDAQGRPIVLGRLL